MFYEVFSAVHTKSPRIKNFQKFLNFEPVKILWNKKGSFKFKGFGYSEEYATLVDDFRWPSKDGDGKKFCEDDYANLNKHLKEIKKEVDYNFAP